MDLKYNMKDITVRTYICEICNKEFTIQHVLPLLLKYCSNCYFKKLKGEIN